MDGTLHFIMREPVRILNVQYSVPVVILVIFVEYSIVVIIDVINMIPELFLGENTLCMRFLELVLESGTQDSPAHLKPSPSVSRAGSLATTVTASRASSSSSQHSRPHSMALQQEASLPPATAVAAVSNFPNPSLARREVCSESRHTLIHNFWTQFNLYFHRKIKQKRRKNLYLTFSQRNNLIDLARAPPPPRPPRPGRG